MRDRLMKMRKRVLDPFLNRDAWNEAVGLLKFKTYWYAFAIVGVAIWLSGAFGSYVLQLPERFALVSTIMIFSAFSCAIFSGIFWAKTCESSVHKFDVMIKLALIWAPITAIPSQALVAHVAGMEFTLSMALKACVYGLAVALLVVATVVLLKFGSKVELYESALQRVASMMGRSKPDALIPTFIESENHYLKVVQGEECKYVRGTFDQVDAEFREYGIRCHRSFWVAHHAMAGLRRRQRQLLLVLKDGTEIPVGRSYEKVVRNIVKFA